MKKTLKYITLVSYSFKNMFFFISHWTQPMKHYHANVFMLDHVTCILIIHGEYPEAFMRSNYIFPGFKDATP